MNQFGYFCKLVIIGKFPAKIYSKWKVLKNKQPIKYTQNFVAIF